MKRLGQLLVLMVVAGTTAPASESTDRNIDRVHDSPEIALADGRLTVDVTEMPIDELLIAIANVTGITVHVHAGVADPVTVRLQSVSVPEGLRRVLRDRNAVVEYGPGRGGADESAEPWPAEIWLLPAGEGSFTSAPGTISAAPDRGTIPPGVPDREWRTALVSENAATRLAVVEAISESGAPAAPRYLRVALDDGDEDIRAAAVAALVEIGSDDAVHALIAALDDQSVEIREDAVEGLGVIGGPTVLQALAAALRDDAVSVRQGAVAALGEIGGEAAARYLADALRDPDESVRDSAREALSELMEQTR